MYLVDIILEAKFFKKIENIESTNVWEGIAQVFSANLDKHKYYKLCNSGLQHILKKKIKDKRVFFEIEQSFDTDRLNKLVTKETAKLYLSTIEPEFNSHNLRNFYKWLEKYSQKNPIEAIGIMEILAAKMNIISNYT